MELSRGGKMAKGLIQVYYGNGRGKTTAALGQGIRAASQGKNVFIIQFLKEKNLNEISFIARLEPEIKLFRFEKADEGYDGLTEEEKEKAIASIRNGMNFAKKVLVTEECQVLILDEALGLLEQGIISIEDMRNILKAKHEETEIILTGQNMCPEIADMMDRIYRIDLVKD